MTARRVLLSISLFMLLSRGSGQAQTSPREPAPLLQTAWARFAERQAAADTADVTWQRESMRTGAAINSPAGRRGPIRPGRPRPMDVVGPTTDSRLVLAGDRGRHEYEWAMNSGGGATTRMTNVFDGKQQQIFNEKGTWGGVKEGKEFDEWGNVHLRALVLSLRPLREEAFGPSPDRWRVESRTAVVDGRSCLVLLDKAAAAGRVGRVYLDPEREFVPLRWEREKGGRASSGVDMKYERTEPPVWVPSSWTATIYHYGDPTSFERSQNQLEEVALGHSVPDDTFTIRFPEGTDLTAVLPGLPDRLIVAEDGKWVPFRQAAAAQSSGTIHWPWLIAATGTAALGVALLMWRRRAAAE